MMSPIQKGIDTKEAGVKGYRTPGYHRTGWPVAVEMGNETPYTPDYWEYCSKFKLSCFNVWKNYFDEKSIVKGIWYKVIQNEPPRVPWFEDTSLGRTYVKLALRLRSGHYPSAKFAFLMRKVTSPNCEVCHKIEDVQHLLMECARSKSERESLLREFELNVFDVGLVQNILANPRTEVAKRLCGLIWTS